MYTVDAVYLVVESIKVIASTLSPAAVQNLIESSFTPTPLERLRNFTIPRKEDLPPDSLREETSPSTVWHSNKFPRDGAKEHYTIGCITKREWGVRQEAVHQGQCCGRH